MKAARAIALASFSGALVCACIVTPDLNGGIAVGPPAAGGAPAPMGGSTGPIEAGCSYNATQLPPSTDGAVFQVACPPGCESTGGLWGTDVYTADSAICKAKRAFTRARSHPVAASSACSCNRAVPPTAARPATEFNRTTTAPTTAATPS